MNREQRRQLKMKFSKRNERDMFGTPQNRANTWGNVQKDSKKSRRNWTKERNGI